VLFCGIVLPKAKQVINLRDLETDLIQGLGTGDKLFVSNDFTYKQLYDLYAENGGDLSTDFLLFNELFKTSTERSQVELVQ
jgi:hypothetical protein